MALSLHKQIDRSSTQNRISKFVNELTELEKSLYPIPTKKQTPPNLTILPKGHLKKTDQKSPEKIQFTASQELKRLTSRG